MPAQSTRRARCNGEAESLGTPDQSEGGALFAFRREAADERVHRRDHGAAEDADARHQQHEHRERVGKAHERG